MKKIMKIYQTIIRLLLSAQSYLDTLYTLDVVTGIKHVILTADNNLDLLKYGRHTETTRLVDILNEHAFVPTISRPTRITSHSATLIDHIFVNSCHAVTNSGVLTEALSDQLPIFVTLLIDPNRINQRLFCLENNSYRTINQSNLDRFKRELQDADWRSVHLVESADDKFNAFETIYTSIYNKNFPCKNNTQQNRKRKCNKPWILPWLESACERKNKLYKIYIKNPSSENETK